MAGNPGRPTGKAGRPGAGLARGAAPRGASGPRAAPLTVPVLVAAVAVALLLGLPVAFRGLYFAPQQLLALVAACAVGALVWWARGRQDTVFWRDRLDAAALALAGAYLLSALTVAVHPNAAVQSWLMRLLYFLVLWSAGEVSRLSWTARRILVFGLLLGGAIAALSGVAAAGGAFAGHGFFLGRRIYTSIQYPDAAAAYLAALAFVALGAEMAAERTLSRVLYAVAAATYLFGFVFALSRGAELVFVPVALIFVGAQRRGRWADGAAALAGPLLGVAAGALPYVRGVAAVSAHRPHGALEVWLGLLAACVVAGVAVPAWDAWRRARGATRLGVALAAAVACAAVAVVLGRRVSHSLLARLGRLSLQGYNAWSRLRWARDALKLVARHPVLGIGGGGWAAAYHSVQSYSYSSTQVHNGWVQTWVSTGTVGMLCWIAFWVFLVLAAWRAWRAATPTTRPLVVGLAAGALMIGGHSAVDFTLSLGGVSVALWGMAGLLRSLAPPASEVGGVPVAPSGRLAVGQGARVPGTAERARPRAPRAAGAGFPLAALGFYGGVGLLAIFALVLWTGGRRINQGNAAAQAGHLSQAAAALRAAASDDPWSATAYFGLAQVEQALASSAPSGSRSQFQDLTQAQADYQHSLALDPFGYLNAGQEHIFYATFLQHVGQMSGALSQLRQAVADGPYVSGAYDALDLGLVDQAVLDARQHHVAAGRQTLAAITQLAAHRAALAASVPGPAKAAAAAGRVAPFTGSDAPMQLAGGEAAALRGAWAQAAATLTPLAGQGGSVGGEASLWLALVDARLHRPATQAVAAARGDLGANYQGQYTLVASVVGALAPGTKGAAGGGKTPAGTARAPAVGQRGAGTAPAGKKK